MKMDDRKSYITSATGRSSTLHRQTATIGLPAPLVERHVGLQREHHGACRVLRANRQCKSIIQLSRLVRTEFAKNGKDLPLLV